MTPSLIIPDSSFDAAICTVSVEYLTRLLDVFAHVKRLLKPGGLFILTFSNRWFPPKVDKIWTEILDSERLGLVLEYFYRTGGFADLATHSSRGWPRLQDDKYYPRCVWLIRSSPPGAGGARKKVGHVLGPVLMRS